MSFSNIVVFPSGIIATSSLLIMTIKVFLSSSLIDLSLTIRLKDFETSTYKGDGHYGC